MSTMASQITSLTIACSNVYSGAVTGEFPAQRASNAKNAFIFMTSSRKRHLTPIGANKITFTLYLLYISQYTPSVTDSNITDPSPDLHRFAVGQMSDQISYNLTCLYIKQMQSSAVITTI